MTNRTAVVIGAGVSGLTTAVCLAEDGVEVQVWAAEPPQRTTSAVAGALWGPCFQEPLAKTLAWTEQSLREFRELAETPDTGVRMALGVTVGELPPAAEPPPQARLIPNLRPCDPEEVPAGFPAGFRGTMPLMDMPRYLGYLADRLTTAGGEVVIRRVESLAEATAAAAIVVNCSGLGARELAADMTVRPVFGQVVAVTNPGLEDIFLELSSAQEMTHYVPHANRVLCGGVSVPDNWDTTPDPAVTERILERCRRVEPRLREAELIDVLTGLRPARPAVRVEAEPLGAARCVHNYGHAGNGVSLSWGCAREATALATA